MTGVQVNPVRVLIVDDSALVRELMTSLLSSDPEIEVVGAAPDAYMAREMIKQLQPDVITLDIEMPKMDGITFLKNLMRLRPMPVVMVSTLTEKGAEITLRCLEFGAVDFVPKPKFDEATDMQHYADLITSKVKGAARARVRTPSASKSPKRAVPQQSVDSASSPIRHTPLLSSEPIIAIAASTGGTEAVREILMELPASAPPVVIAQHIPAMFSGAFAERVDRDCVITVSEAEDRQPILNGHAYIAPGDQHLIVEKSGSGLVCRLTQDEKVNRHRPSCDILFHSVAKAKGAKAIGVILTGMGRDGALGLLELQSQGATTIAQDEESSVVWGMPGAAVELGAAGQVLSLADIARHINQLVNPESASRTRYATTTR